jgi:hypothetical protein
MKKYSSCTRDAQAIRCEIQRRAAHKLIQPVSLVEHARKLRVTTETKAVMS